MATYKFRAADAFNYVDTYRREILLTANRIEADKKQIEEQMLTAQEAPSRVYAKLRAIEHALGFVVEKKDPGLVVLGDVSANESEDDDGAAQDSINRKELEQQLKKREAEVSTLEQSLNQAQEKLQDFEAELIAREQQINRLTHRLNHSQSTILVLSAATAVLGVGLLFLFLT